MCLGSYRERRSLSIHDTSAQRDLSNGTRLALASKSKLSASRFALVLRHLGDMEDRWQPLGHRKRKRRRRDDRIPLPACLQPVDRFKGEIGVVSTVLFDRLFQQSGERYEEEDDDSSNIKYIAVTADSAATPNCVATTDWILLPVRSQTLKEEEALKLDATIIQYPSSSLALRSFVLPQQNNSGGRGPVKSGIEVRILDVEPLILDTIFVDVDGDLLDKHDEVQKKFGGGFLSSQSNGHAAKGKGKAMASMVNGLEKSSPAQIQDDQLKSAVRDAFAASAIVHQNDLLLLPLPAHPITHVPFPPSKITFCEPVSQGILSASTRIIINRRRHLDPAKRTLPSVTTNKALRGLEAGFGDETSNEQFFSAAENGEGEDQSPEQVLDSTSENENSASDSDNSSDEALGEMISMKAPRIPVQASGVLSSRTAATPRAGSNKHGISSPGSVFSNMTTTTTRQLSSGKAKSFQAKCLTRKIAEDMLHPKPAPDEDDESRIYVDIKALLKLGCFSGDWVKVQATVPTQTLPSGVWGFETPSEDGVHEVFKPVKIYGLPNLQPLPPPRYINGRRHERRSSALAAPVLEQASPAAWLSPIMLSNLGNPSSVNISVLVNPSVAEKPSRSGPRKPKVHGTALPPLARELTLLRVATPLSTERALQAGLFAALKSHFESKRRILQHGDLLALPIDTSTSRLLFSAINTTDPDPDAEQLLNASNDDLSASNATISIAWFKVGSILAQEADTESLLPPDLWGGAASIEPLTTRMRQVGSEQCKLPATLRNTWELYLGIKAHPVWSSTKQSVLTQYTNASPSSFVSPLRRRLRELMAAATSPRALHLGMDPIFICLHSTQRNIGKASAASMAAADLGLHIFEIDAIEIMAEGAGGGDVKTEGFLRVRVDRALSCGSTCTAILLRHVEVFTADRMVTALRDIVKEVRILIATTTEIDKVPEGIRSVFSHELEHVAPDEGEREGILQSIVQDRALGLARDLALSSIAVKTAALVAGNLVDIVDRASIAKQQRLAALITKQGDKDQDSSLALRDVLVSGGDFARCIIKEDFDLAVEAARKNFADAIGAPKIPNVGWDDVGGLENVKEAVMETIQLPLERPELFAKGMKKRSGILFYGPPGTGKTLLAKAIATEFSLNFFSVKGPELLNMYIGESEANVRRVFQRARDARPCVVFFDELDSVAPKRGNQGDSGGVMDRIVSQLLAELDGMSDGTGGGGGVFVIGATNRPDLLDQALLRPGRFDKMLYLGISDTHQKQLTILEALTRKFTLHPDLSLRRVAESLPFTYTGADLYALCSDAMLKSITRQTSAVDAKIKALPGGPVTTAYFFDHMAKEEDIAVMVTEEDFSAAQRELVGSVS